VEKLASQLNEAVISETSGSAHAIFNDLMAIVAKKWRSLTILDRTIVSFHGYYDFWTFILCEFLLKGVLLNGCQELSLSLVSFIRMLCMQAKMILSVS